MSVRMIQAPLSAQFSLVEDEEEFFDREYHKLSESDDDPIAQWLKLAKAKGETAESDPVLLNLLIEMHRKIDNLERLIKNEEPQRIKLSYDRLVNKIGYGYFELKDEVLEIGAYYYARIDMPVHPKRDIALFFIAESPTLAKIDKMHDRDEKEWAGYLTARERVLIRQMRAKRDTN